MQPLFHLQRLSHNLHQYKVPLLPNLVYSFCRIAFGCSVPPRTRLGSGTKFSKGGIAVIIHPRSEIGMNCLIGSCVTIGGTTSRYGVPKIGSNVYIGSGAKIIGDISVGDNVVVGVNSVVTKDVPPNCVVAGIPARVVKEDIDITDYLKIAK